jgi:ubiquinone/menaquinone biosynthesis C-methylase UbiE
MKKYMIEIYGKNIQHELGIPINISVVYLRLFGVPLGKRSRFKTAKHFLRNMDLKGKNILDAGCGIGDFSFYLADKGANVIGIDVDGPKIEIANEIASLYAKDAFVKFFCKDLMKIETLPKESFDGIICLAVLEHIEHDDGVLKYFYDILKKDGFLILHTETNSRKVVKEIETEAGHTRIGYSEKQLKQILTSIGFVVEDISYDDPFDMYYYFNKLSNLMPTPRFKKIFSAVLFPFFGMLISVSSSFISSKGSEFTFRCSK